MKSRRNCWVCLGGDESKPGEGKSCLGRESRGGMLQISNSEMGQSESASVLQSEVDCLCFQLAETYCELESKRSENELPSVSNEVT